MITDATMLAKASEMIGKTVRLVFFDYQELAIRFTDGSIIRFYYYGGYFEDSPEMLMTRKLPAEDTEEQNEFAYALGFISKEEYEEKKRAWRETAAEKQTAIRRRKWEKLNKEFGAE